MRLEVTRGGDVVHGEDYGAASSVVLSRAEEAFGDGHLVSDLPGMAGRLARRVAWAVGGRGGDRAGCPHPFCGLPVLVEILDGNGPGGSRRLLSLGWVQGGCDPDVHRARGQRLGRRRRAEQVEARAALAYAGYPCGEPVAAELWFSLPPCGVCLLCGCRWFIL